MSRSRKRVYVVGMVISGQNVARIIGVYDDKKKAKAAFDKILTSYQHIGFTAHILEDTSYKHVVAIDHNIAGFGAARVVLNMEWYTFNTTYWVL